MPFIPHTSEEKQQMLAEIGLAREDLFGDIPDSLKADSFQIPEGLSEQQVHAHLRQLSMQNGTCLPCFIGGGIYDHYQPAAADAIISRSEFYTAYTPYQPERSQGTLQAIYEYQSAICRLSGLDVSNASLYDGGTALFEAALTAMRVTRRKKIIVDSSVNALWRNMLATYTANLDAEVVTVEHKDGRANRSAIAAAVDKNTAAVLCQNPSFFGCLDDLSDIGEIAHAAKALLVVGTYPIALGIIKTPGEMAADIAVGEGQCMGLPMAFGGPHLGFIAATEQCMRKMPGRMAGRTLDADGKEGFVLTLQAREQHIRREKATSNICTNHGLCALAVTVNLSLLGRTGFEQTARLCLARAEYLKKAVADLDAFELVFEGPTFNEFAVRYKKGKAAQALAQLQNDGFLAGVDLGPFDPARDDTFLVAVTECRTRKDLDRFIAALEGL
ncbi:MAG: aminomethyl-transferring glycine dehydrogenase subunit GcvPA [Planctomycetota bacterium]